MPFAWSVCPKIGGLTVEGKDPVTDVSKSISGCAAAVTFKSLPPISKPVLKRDHPDLADG